MLKAGVVGCGGIAEGKHIPAIKKIKEVEIVALCDIIPEKMDIAAEKFKLETAKKYIDYKEMLKSEKLDIVYVLTPNSSHSEISVAAMESGCNVMCEKPMAKTVEQAKAMVECAKRTGKILTIGYQNRFRHDSLYLKKACERGDLGEVYFAKAHAIRRRAVPTWGVFLDEEKQGGGPLIDIGTHALDLTLWITQNYKPKYCVGTTYHKLNKDTNQGNAWGNWDPSKFTVEDSAFGFVVMENGATIYLEAAWALNTLDVREAVTSVCGTLAGADMTEGLRINGIRNNIQYTLTPALDSKGAAFYDGIKGESMPDREARLWIDAVVNDKPTFVLPEEAYTVTQILEGIYESAKSGDVYRFTK